MASRPHRFSPTTAARTPRRRGTDLSRRISEHNVSAAAGGIAFFGLLSLAPLLAAMVSVYGLFSTASQVESRIRSLTQALPGEAQELIVSQMRSISSSSSSGLGWPLILGIVLALVSASSAVRVLITTVNIAYGSRGRRGGVVVRLLAVAFTLGAIVFIGVIAFLVAALPAFLARFDLPTGIRVFIGVLRFPVIAALMYGALTLVYRYGPKRGVRRTGWRNAGAATASVIWVLGSALFSLYTANFGRYDTTYGALGTVVVAMLWFYLTAFAAVVGAELNAMLEEDQLWETRLEPAAPVVPGATAASAATEP